VYLNRVIVGWIYWAYDLQEAIYFGDSRHGSEWPPQIHWSWHQTLNSLRESGIQIVNATYDGDGSQDAHFQFGITAGTLWHEDIHTSVDAVSDAEALPVWYFDAAGESAVCNQRREKVSQCRACGFQFGHRWINPGNQ
jgi:hypothetical protein